MVLTHRYAEAWTIPHRTSSHSRFVNEADARRSGSTALTTAIEEVFSEVREERAKRYAIWPLRLVPMFATVVALINAQGRADESRPSTEGGEKKC